MVIGIRYHCKVESGVFGVIFFEALLGFALATVLYTIEITHVPTGSIHRFTEAVEVEDEYSFVYRWLEGNQSCDCNRDIYCRPEVYRADPDYFVDCGSATYRCRILREDGTTALDELQ